MLHFAIYVEGYRGHVAQGEYGYAHYVGQSEGCTFQEACQNYYSKPENNHGREYNGEWHPYYRPITNSYWACRLFDNLKDAQNAFG